MRSYNNMSPMISPRRSLNNQNQPSILESKCRIEYLEGTQAYRQPKVDQEFDKFAVLQPNNKLVIYRSNQSSPLLDNRIKELFKDQYHKRKFIQSQKTHG